MFFAIGILKPDRFRSGFLVSIKFECKGVLSAWYRRKPVRFGWQDLVFPLHLAQLDLAVSGIGKDGYVGLGR